MSLFWLPGFTLMVAGVISSVCAEVVYSMKALIKSTIHHPWRGLLQMPWWCELRGCLAIIDLPWGWCSTIVPGNSGNKKFTTSIGFHKVYDCWLLLWVRNIDWKMSSHSCLQACSLDTIWYKSRIIVDFLFFSAIELVTAAML